MWAPIQTRCRSTRRDSWRWWAPAGGGPSPSSEAIALSLERVRRIAAFALALFAAAGPAHGAALPSTRHVLLGHSAEGRPIKAVRVGDPTSPRKALAVGVIHGNEAAGLRITRALRRQRVHGVDLWVVNSVNPDGLAHGARQNA